MLSNPSSTTLTFLFTDIEGSSKLWEQNPQAMQPALAQHDAILRAAVENNRGRIVKTTGDGVHAGFENAQDALAAGLLAQRQLQAPCGGLLFKVRMSLHSGEAEQRAGDYYGTALNRAARLMSAAFGGQILISNAAAELTRDQLPAGAGLRDLGEHRLKDLTRPERVFQLLHPDLPDTFPPLPSIDSFPNNLPVQLTSFVGREKEMAEIRGLLAAARLVTLTGSGGTGKTRLALEVGAQELSAFTHGVWLAELAPLADPAQIIPAVAHMFGLQELPFTSLTAQLNDYLRDKQLLLLLDNCEHLIDACARLSDDWLRQCPRLKILASSREALGIAGEMAYRIPSLATAESTWLFEERARAANSRFALTDANQPAVAMICARLDGIPLAIELAAARAGLLTPEQIAARLDDRFRLLVGGSRTALPRQQTLRALIDWSYDLLTEGEKYLLRCASIFMGGATLDALEAVTGSVDVLDHLQQLVNKSLVMSEVSGSEMRYLLLETIRQYAREKLLDAGQATEIRERHFAYFDQFSEGVWAAFRTGEQAAWRDRVDSELENLRSAINWGLDSQDIDRVLHLAASFCVGSGWIGNEAEGAAICDLAIQRAKAAPPGEGDAHHRQRLLARALFAQSIIDLGLGNTQRAVRNLQEAIDISRSAGDTLLLGYCLEMYYTAGQFVNAPGTTQAAQEGYRLFTEVVEDRWGAGMAYLNMARIADHDHDLQAKDRYLHHLKQIIQDLPPSFQSGMFFMAMGMDESFHGNYAPAKQYFEYGLDVFERIRNLSFQRVMLSELGHIARHTGDLAQARKLYRDTIQGFQDLGNRPAISHQLECFGFLAHADENPHTAVKLFAAGQALRELIESHRTEPEEKETAQVLAQLRSLLGEQEFDRLWTEGYGLAMDQAIELALSA